MEIERIEFINPYTKVVLSFPFQKVKEAVRFVLSTVGIRDLDDALVNCWQLSVTFSEREREMLSVVQTIVSGTKDGYVRPEDFDIYGLARVVADELALKS